MDIPDDKVAGALQSIVIHPLTVRVCHWLNVFAILVMMLSGWRIYNASPLFGFSFPPSLTLGGWHAGSLQWHFAAMWLLAINGLIYVVYGLLSGHYRKHFLPLTPAAILGELGNVVRGRMTHRLGVYNPLQKTAYIAVVLMAIAIVLSGLAIWKPVQLQGLAAFMGGYEGARLVHFFAMAGIGGFVVVHIFMVLLVPSTFPPMLTGRAPPGTETGEH